MPNTNDIQNENQNILFENDEDEIEINFLDFFYAIKRKFFFILAVGLAAGCAAALCAEFIMTPMYTSKSSILVLSTQESTLTSLSDLQMGTTLTSDYSVMVQSTSVLDQTISDLSLDMEADELKKYITVENPEDSRILEITVEYTDPVLAKSIADKIAEVASGYIGDSLEVKPPKIIEQGKLPTERSSPSVLKYTVIGVLLGIAASVGSVVVRVIMDDTIKTEEDIARYLGITVLAKIPDRKDYVNVGSGSKKKKVRRRKFK